MKNKKALLILTIITGILICVFIIDSEKFKEQTKFLLSLPIAGKGIAMPYVFAEDLERTNSSWYYNWGTCSTIPPGCVPMSWSGTDPNLPTDYSDYILLFNEPDRPDQANLTPETGIIIYKQFKLKYPDAKWVVGNTFYPEWLYKFRDLCLTDVNCIMPEYWGLHAYMGNIEYLSSTINRVKSAHNNLGGTFWITEFAAVYGDIKADDGLVKFFESQPWIERWAIFCNRAQGTEPWYPTHWVVRMFDWDTGAPTKIGNWYINGLYDNLLPLVMR
jgi:hypothetical protein